MKKIKRTFLFLLIFTSSKIDIKAYLYAEKIKEKSTLFLFYVSNKVFFFIESLNDMHRPYN